MRCACVARPDCRRRRWRRRCSSASAGCSRRRRRPATALRRRARRRHHPRRAVYLSVFDGRHARLLLQSASPCLSVFEGRRARLPLQMPRSVCLSMTAGVSGSPCSMPCVFLHCICLCRCSAHEALHGCGAGQESAQQQRMLAMLCWLRTSGSGLVRSCRSLRVLGWVTSSSSTRASSRRTRKPPRRRRRPGEPPSRLR
jgi:hypothetical protein